MTIRLFNVASEYVLSSCCVPDSVLSTGETPEVKTDTNTCPGKPTSQWGSGTGETINTSTHRWVALQGIKGL